MIRVAACQVRLDIDAPDRAWADALAAVRAAAAGGARLVVLPELASSGYVFASRAEAQAAATPADGDVVGALADLSGELDVVLVAGWAEAAPGGPYNSAVVLERGRVLGVYRKVHLWGDEPGCFTPGGDPPLVVDTRLGRVAVMICYDLEFPEWVRLARQRGADVVVAPVNWPLLDRPADQPPLELLRAQATAGAYRIPIVVADRAGRERGVDWIGGSCVVGRDGYLLAAPTLDGERPGSVTADVEPAGDTSIGPRNDVLGDRRPDLYLEG